MTAQDIEDLAGEIDRIGGGDGIVCIDTLNRASPGADENDSKDMGVIIEAAKTLQRKVGGDAVLVDMTRQLPNPPGIFVLDDGMGLVAKRLEHIPNSDPPAVRVISDNKLYPEYERTAEEIRIIGRIRWFAREI
jgi:hypothetical protein